MQNVQDWWEDFAFCEHGCRNFVMKQVNRDRHRLGPAQASTVEWDKKFLGVKVRVKT